MKVDYQKEKDISNDPTRDTTCTNHTDIKGSIEIANRHESEPHFQPSLDERRVSQESEGKVRASTVLRCNKLFKLIREKDISEL
jgi:hypothetical protein